MFMLHHSASLIQVPGSSHNRVSPQFTYSQSFQTFPPPIHSPFHSIQSSCIRTQTNCQRAKTRNLLTSFQENNDDDYNDGEMEEGDGVACGGVFKSREDEKNYDKDPELAEILVNCLDDPDKSKSKLEERLRKKRNNIVHTKTGSATPMRVKFNKKWAFYHVLTPSW